MKQTSRDKGPFDHRPHPSVSLEYQNWARRSDVVLAGESRRCSGSASCVNRVDWVLHRSLGPVYRQTGHPTLHPSVTLSLPAPLWPGSTSLALQRHDWSAPERQTPRPGEWFGVSQTRSRRKS